jgi:hypothetical protein
VVKALRAAREDPLRRPPDDRAGRPYLEAFRAAGADIISVHPEAGRTSTAPCKRIRELGAKAGVVFNPSTDPSVIQWMMDEVDLVLVMSSTRASAARASCNSQLGRSSAARMIDDGAATSAGGGRRGHAGARAVHRRRGTALVAGPRFPRRAEPTPATSAPCAALSRRCGGPSPARPLTLALPWASRPLAREERRPLRPLASGPRPSGLRRAPDPRPADRSRGRILAGLRAGGASLATAGGDPWDRRPSRASPALHRFGWLHDLVAAGTRAPRRACA